MNKKDTNTNVLDLFHDKELVKICAPMVRYSKLQFRNLVKLYDCDLTFTPMILADSFCKSDKARQNEFTTNSLDTPLVAQFAAKTVHDFVGAAYLAAPYCDGVDLNCGCPQRWAMEEQLGSALLKTPELIYDLVRQCRNQIQKPFSVSVKMRLSSDVGRTVGICKQLEQCGASFLTVHARTATQLAGEINETALKLVKENCSIPIVANGGVSSLEDCVQLQKCTGCDGVMVANGVLCNPTLFSGAPVTSVECIQNWLDICYNSTLRKADYDREATKTKCWIAEKPRNLTFQCFHHHLVFMLEKILPRKQRRIFNNFKTFQEVLVFIEDYFNVKPRLFSPQKFSELLAWNIIDYCDREDVYDSLKPSADSSDAPCLEKYDCVQNNGRYFTNKISPVADYEDLNDIFLENEILTSISYKLVKENCSIPIVANGGVSSLEDCVQLQKCTGCDGVMVANGVLCNPTLFSGAPVTSVECIQNWLDICYNSTLRKADYDREATKTKCWIAEKPRNLTFQCFHHHLVFMLEKVLPRKQRRIFNNFKTFQEVLVFMEDYFNVKPRLFSPQKFSEFLAWNIIDYCDREDVYGSLKPSADSSNAPCLGKYDCVQNNGKYFTNKISPVGEYEDLNDIFLENG